MIDSYLPRHDTQFEPRTKASPFDCNMAASADALRFYTLGHKDYNHDELRHLTGTYSEVTDNNPNNNGTSINDAVNLLRRMGVDVVGYDGADSKGFTDVVAALNRGEGVIAHGDYGAVPKDLRGAIDRTFNGMHSVFFHPTIKVVDGVKSIKVGDGLADAWKWWPLGVAQKYMAGFFGSGFTFARIVPARLHAKRVRAAVRVRPAFRSKALSIFGATGKVHYYGTVKGTRAADKHRWYRAYNKGSMGYVHSTVSEPR